MPKDTRDRSVSQERHSSASPFSYRPLKRHKLVSSPSSSQNPIQALSTTADFKEWEETRCPICMEHPHNAVLLLCSSNKKGCRAYMCDTSYRHSNCLDQFRKSMRSENSLQENTDEHVESKLYCPLCRGTVEGWMVVEAARQYMNLKSRSCSLESCEYSGTYKDLRKHARVDHPFQRPAQVDPERQHDWRRMERQSDLADLLTSMRSSLGMEEGEVEVGDIVNVDEEGSLLRASGSFAQVTLYIFIRVLGTERPNVLQYVSRTTSRTNADTRRTRTRHRWEPYDGDVADSTGEPSDGEAATDEFVLGPPGFHRSRSRSRRRQMRLPDEDDTL